jgi:hypothetical protein
MDWKSVDKSAAAVRRKRKNIKAQKKIYKEGENKEEEEKWDDMSLEVFDLLKANKKGMTSDRLAFIISKNGNGQKVTKKMIGDALYEGKISLYVSRNPTSRLWTLNNSQ